MGNGYFISESLQQAYASETGFSVISVAFFDGQGCKLQQGRRREAIAFFFCKGEDDEVH